MLLETTTAAKAAHLAVSTVYVCAALPWVAKLPVAFPWFCGDEMKEMNYGIRITNPACRMLFDDTNEFC